MSPPTFVPERGEICCSHGRRAPHERRVAVRDVGLRFLVALDRAGSVHGDQEREAARGADVTTLRAVALNCTLKSGDDPSSTDTLLGEVLAALRGHDVKSDAPIRIANLDIKPGVKSDEGDGDEWPGVRQQILDADILVLGTPIWMGQPSSVCKRVLERLDAALGEKDDRGRMITYDRVAIVAVVGNEDGAHHVSAELYQALSDVGFTIAAGGVTYWVGEAMQSTDYKDVTPKPEKTAATTKTAAANAAHLARLLRDSGYPA
jgi:multimeric flavodoxin WrbA